MKPVVSSLVALAIAIAPLAAMAATEKSSAAHHGKAATTKIVKHKAHKSEKHDKPIAKVKHSGKKPALHHASHVDVSGGGHHEPKIEKHVSVVPASMMSKTEDHAKKDKVQKVSHVTPAPKANEMPKLPDPKATKPTGKNAHEKGVKKGAEKKSEPKGESASNDGESQRDEGLAELVAQIRRGETNAKKGKPGAAEKKPCLKDPVEIIRGPEIQKMELMTCDGAPAPLAVEQLSILIRPGSAARPTTPIAELAKKKGPDLAPGIRRVDTRLVERIQAVVDHFGKHGPTKLSIISGYRPTSVGSMHSSGRAIDFRMEGVKNEDVVSFCKTLSDTGCGFYPNSSFVHIDVRDPGAGHVAWIDASGPGETPRYVSQWPPPESKSANKDENKDEIRKPSDVLEHTSAKRTESSTTSQSEPVDEHPAAPQNALDEPEKDSAKTAED